MRTVMRLRSFETNSSSEHALVWYKDYVLPTSSDIHYIPQEGFGQFAERYTEPEYRLAYLYFVIKNGYYDNPIAVEAWKERLIDVLNLPDDIAFDEEDDGWGTGYVDHGGLAFPLVEAMLEDDEMLRSFVYGKGTIETMSDGDDAPEGYLLSDFKYRGGWNDDTDDWEDSEVPWYEIVDEGDRYVFIKGN